MDDTEQAAKRRLELLRRVVQLYEDDDMDDLVGWAHELERLIDEIRDELARE